MTHARVLALTWPLLSCNLASGWENLAENYFAFKIDTGAGVVTFRGEVQCTSQTDTRVQISGGGTTLDLCSVSDGTFVHDDTVPPGSCSTSTKTVSISYYNGHTYNSSFLDSECRVDIDYQDGNAQGTFACLDIVNADPNPFSPDITSSADITDGTFRCTVE